MNKIHIDNYEAYYLDYLEGNLSPSDEKLFLAFLNQHPELELDGDLVYLDDSSQINFPLKESLLVFDETEIINESNLDGFMIASVENELSAQKNEELQNFISKNHHVQNDFQTYQKTKLKPDLSVVYPHKTSLQKNKTVPIYSLFSIVASVAAVFILFFTLYPTSNQSFTFYTASRSTNHFPQIKKTSYPVSTSNSEFKLVQFSSMKSSFTTSESTEISTIPTRKATLFQTKPLMHEPISVDYAQITDKYKNEQQDFALMGMNDMKNPIQPITNKLAEWMKTEVDFKTKQAKLSFKDGFYLKIGRFEVSRNIKENESLAVSFK